MVNAAKRINLDSEYRFSSVDLRYHRRDNGRVLRLVDERRLEELIRDRMRRELMSVTRRYQAGRITKRSWRRQAGEVLRRGHYESAAFAVGGEGGLPPAAKRAIDALIAEELGYLAGLGEDIRSGRTTMPVALRVARYALATSLSISKARHEAHKAAGFTKAKRTLDPRVGVLHCKHCPGLATNGWVGIDKVVPRGWECDCRNACRCTVRYRR